MAAAFIPVDTSKPLGNQILQCAIYARQFADQVNAVKAIMDACTSGSDYSVLEQQFGIPAGRGADVAYLMASLQSGLAGIAQFGLLPNWFGQV